MPQVNILQTILLKGDSLKTISPAFYKARDLKSIGFVFMWANFYFIHSIQLFFMFFFLFSAELNSSMIVADYNITKAQFRHSAKIFSSYFSSNGFKYI